MGFDLGNILQQYLGGAGNQQLARDPQQTVDDFERVASTAHPDQLAAGVTQALRSDQTPPFSQLVGQLFGHGDPHQRAGMLNQLIGGAGPGLLSSLGGALGSLYRGHESSLAVTPEQAVNVSPDEVSRIAAEAERTNPGVVDRMGDFYAQHPNLVKGLGGAALAIALGHIAQNMRR